MGQPTSEKERKGNLFGMKDPIPGGLRSRVVYKFACAGSNACYVRETTQHFPHACVSIQSVIGPLTFSNTQTILNVVARCVQWTVFIFQITPLPRFN